MSRTARSEFWAAHGIAVGAIAASAILGSGALSDFVALTVFAAWVWLSIGSSVNRLHDLGYSGWMVLLYLMPVANFVVWVWLGSAKGEAHDNEWGPPVGNS